MFESSRKPERDAIAVSLRYLREHARLTQSDVADAIGAVPAAISQFEHGGGRLGKDKIARLPALFGCESLQDMVDKANALPPEPDRDKDRERDAIAVSLRYLREHARLTLSDVAHAIGAGPAAISQFEHGGGRLGKDKIAQLPALFGCKSLQDMVDKANALPPEPDKAAIAQSLRYLRQNARLTLSDVAHAIGVARQAVHQFEHSDKTPLGKDKIARLPALFGCESLQDMVDKAKGSVPTQYSHRDAMRTRAEKKGADLRNL